MTSSSESISFPHHGLLRSSDLDAWVLAAVAESLHRGGGGEGGAEGGASNVSYSQLARDLVIEPLGITLGLPQDVRAYHSKGQLAPAAAQQYDAPALTPVGGLILTPNGAMRYGPPHMMRN